MNKTDIEKYVKTEQKKWDSIYSNRFDLLLARIPPLRQVGDESPSSVV